ncbi:dUTP diphosphatase [Staphylococcus sp. NRL 19/737]|nr:dUTP diphosphatase [Staphylococcus sp. NRL 19/737]MCJ1668556.1 dUTP diphosphatase [Staphylococcus sp. NRL 19/737]
MINDILNIRDSYQAPRKIMEILHGDIETRNIIFMEFLEAFDKDVSFDWFHDYFQDEHANRKKHKQDFTPQSISRLLADMLAFGLSIANQCEDETEEKLEYVDNGYLNDYLVNNEIDFNNKDCIDEIMSDINELYDGWYCNNLFLPFCITYKHYSIDQLITAYKKKMERNHARQNGTADKDKGYV